MKTRKNKENMRKPAPPVKAALEKTDDQTGRASAILIAALLVIQFVYFWKFIRPELYFTAQEPVFFLEYYFFRSFLLYPSGLLDYLSAFIGHLNYLPWLGALALALVNTGIVVLLGFYIKRMIADLPPVLPALPLIPLLLLHNNYFHAPTLNLALMLALALVSIHTLIKRNWARALFFVIAGSIFYFAAGSTLFLYGFMAILFELLKKRNLPALLFLPFFLAIPLLAGRLFAVAPADAFRLPLLHRENVAPHPLLFWVVLALTLILALSGQALWKKHFFKTESLAVQGVVVIGLMMIIPLSLFDHSSRQFWQFNYYSHTSQWQKVLALCEKPFLNNKQVMLIINRALNNTGRLGDRMFFYGQPFGREGLFVFDDYSVSTILVRSDVYFDIGHYNAAKQWAHEAASVRGETVWNVQRLALTYLISDQIPAAEIYFRKLEHSLFHREWARRFRPFWKGEAELRSDSYLNSLAVNMVEKDFITFVGHPEQDLPHLLAKNPRNRQALEALLADLLLSKRLQLFVEEVQSRNLLGRSDLPRHYQEALMFYISQTDDEAEDLKNFKPSRAPADEFRKFQKLAHQQRGNLQNAKNLFEAFRHTYWYYLVFHQAQKGAKGTEAL